MCLLGVSLILPPFWGWNNPKPPVFGAWIGVFKPNAKYWKFHVIETTASILTKFGVTIKTTKWSSWVVPVGAQQIQDGGRPPFWKNRQITVYLRPFDRSWWNLARWHILAPGTGWTVKILNFWSGGRHLEKKSQKSRYFRNGLTDLYKIWYADAKWAS